MKPVILVRYNEISLKGKNRKWYEQKLIENIKQTIKKEGKTVGPIERRLGRIILHTGEKFSFLKRVFGIASYSPAIETAIEITKMADATLRLVELHSGVSFRASCQRLDKTTELNSLGVERQLGAEIVERTNAEVDLTEYDINVCVELINQKAYVFTEKTNCFGGLPINTQGTILAVIENKADELAALLMLRRGCTIIPISTKDHPLLTRYGAQPSVEINEMDNLTAEAVVTGQTLEKIQQPSTTKLVLRPLIGMTDKEITTRLNEFSAY